MLLLLARILKTNPKPTTNPKPIQNQPQNSNNIWRAPIAACALGGLMVTLFNVVSCGVLLRRSMVRSAAPGFGYGCMLAATFVLSFLTLLVGLVLEGFRGTVGGELMANGGAGAAGGAAAGSGGGGGGAWSDLANGTFAAAYGFSYLVAALFALFFLVLLVFQGAVTRELGIKDAMRAHARAAEMGALASATGHGNGAAAGGVDVGGGMAASPI